MNILIPKKAGNFKVGRLRSIFLYEVDFKFNFDDVGSESNQVLAREQYDSRQRKSAIEYALIIINKQVLVGF